MAWPGNDKKRDRASALEGDQTLGVGDANASTKPPPSKKTKVYVNSITIDGDKTAPRTGTRANNGNLHLYFVSMGQGDCTVLITPSGHAFMFDIGSSAWDEEIYGDNHRQSIVDFLQGDMIFGVNSTLKGLVITHSDEDHNNRAYFLNAMSVKADVIYHTNRFEKYNKKPKGGKQLISAMLKTLNDDPTGLSFTSTKAKPPSLPDFSKLYPNVAEPSQQNYAPVQPYQSYRLSSGTMGTLTQQNPPPALDAAPADPFVPYWAEGRGFVIHDEVLGDKRCTIRILVANYRDFADAYNMSQPEKKYGQKAPAVRKEWQTAYDLRKQNNLLSPRWEGRDANQASAVILIEYSDTSGGANIKETYMICGDATYKTLDMVMREYETLKDVTLFQAPHHGAASEGSDAPKFIQRFNPKIAVYSAPYYGERFGHPSASSVKTMEAQMRTSGTTSADIHANYIFWETESIDKDFIRCTDQPYRIYVTGWMRDGCYHYSPPYAPNTNIPRFRSDRYLPKPEK